MSDEIKNTEEMETPDMPEESMADYEAELEASFKKIREGDILTGTVIGVEDDRVILDLKYYAEGIISKEDLSNDPEFNLKEEIHLGDEITATVFVPMTARGTSFFHGKRPMMYWPGISLRP